MKILIALVILVAIIWLVRAARKDEPKAGDHTAPVAKPVSPIEVSKPTQVLQCHHCGVHVPASDCVPGKKGVYCTVAHREAVEF